MKTYCSDVSTCNFKAGQSVNQVNQWSETTDGADYEDWENPFEDDDSDNPFCTAPTESDSDYACTKIICIQQRLVDTGDVADFIVNPDARSDTDFAGSTITIRPGRA